MPAQMAMEKPIARIGGEPGGQVGAGRVRLAALVTNMREPVRAMRVVRVRRHRSLDLRPGGGELPILGQRHGMIGQEPPIVAVMRGEAVHQHRDLVLLPDAAGGADQAVRVRGSGEHQRVARPFRQMRVQGGDRGVGPAGEREVEDTRCDWPRAPTDRRPRPWPPPGPPAPPRRCLRASVPGPCRHGPGRNRGRRRWRGQRPRSRRDRGSAPDRSPERRRPARRRRQWTKEGRIGPPTCGSSWRFVEIYRPLLPSRKGLPVAPLNAQFLRGRHRSPPPLCRPSLHGWSATNGDECHRVEPRGNWVTIAAS